MSKSRRELWLIGAFLFIGVIIKDGISVTLACTLAVLWSIKQHHKSP